MLFGISMELCPLNKNKMKHNMRMFEKRTLSKIRRTEKEEVTGS
jgi:hypothetical protein